MCYEINLEDNKKVFFKNWNGNEWIIVGWGGVEWDRIEVIEIVYCLW